MNKIMCIAFLALLLTATAGATEVGNLVETGNKLWSGGNLEQAEATFREAISLDPEAALPHARLAGLLLSQNRNDEARTDNGTTALIPGRVVVAAGPFANSPAVKQTG